MYRPSEKLSKVIVRRHGKPSKKKLYAADTFYDRDLNTTDEVLCVTDYWKPMAWKSGDREIIVSDVWIGWSRDAGATEITDDNLIERHSYRPLTSVALTFLETREIA